MKKSILLILFISGIVAFKQVGNELRAQSFPKIEIKANDLPDKSDLWVFILGGQSNMAGRGLVEPQDTIPSSRIFTLNKNGEVIVAKEPLHFYEPALKGLDCGLSFGKELIRQLPDSISLLIIPTAVGGSSISQWLGDSTHRDVQLFTNFAEKTKIGQQHGTIKGVLWHQGESDAIDPNDIEAYWHRLAQLLVKFRRVIGNDKLPVLIGDLGSFSKNDKNWRKINKQVRRYVRTDRFASRVKTADLKEKGDKIHFDSQGQRILGERFAKEYIRKY